MGKIQNSDEDYAGHVRSALDTAGMAGTEMRMMEAQVHATLALAAAVRGLGVTLMIANNIDTEGRK